MTMQINPTGITQVYKDALERLVQQIAPYASRWMSMGMISA
jgi:hypothetical protein